MGQKTPGIQAAMSTPGMAPAIIPDPLSLPPSASGALSPTTPGARNGLTLSLGLQTLKDTAAVPLLGLSPIPGSPAGVGSPTPKQAYNYNSITPGASTFGKAVSSADYFSQRTTLPRTDEGPEAAADGGATPGAATALGSSVGPGANSKAVVDTAVPPTPGPVTPGGGLMGRLRNFGKAPKRHNAAEEAPSAAPIAEEADVVEDSPTVSFNHQYRL